jgi:hypothetical protein
MYEQEMSESLEVALRKLLPAGHFHVIVSIALKQEAKQISKEITQSEKSKKGEASKKSLPGYEISQTPSDHQEKEQSSNIQLEQDVKIETMNVLLLVQKSLSQEDKNLALDITKKKLQASFSGKSTVELKDANFVRETKIPLKDLLLNQMEDKIFYLAVLAVLVFLLLLSLPFFLMFNLRRAKKQDNDESPQNTEGDTKQVLHHYGVDTNLEKIVDFISEHPLAFKDFYNSLPIKDKDILNSVFEQTPFRDLVREICQIEFLQASQSFDEQEKYKKIELIISFIDQFKKLHQVVKDRAFGFMENHPASKIAQFLGEKPAEEVALVLVNLESNYTRDILKDIKPALKSEVIKLANNPKKLAEIYTQSKTLEKKFREELDFGVLDSAPLNDNSILNIFIENDARLEDTVRLANLSKEFLEKYSLNKYLLTFKELLNLEGAVLTSLMQHLSNESIAAAMHGQENAVSTKILGLLPGLRKKIVETLIHSLTHEESQVEQAQQEFLREYRRRRV